jgi:hypothetical protein
MILNVFSDRLGSTSPSLSSGELCFVNFLLTERVKPTHYLVVCRHDWGAVVRPFFASALTSFACFADPARLLSTRHIISPIGNLVRRSRPSRTIPRRRQRCRPLLPSLVYLCPSLRAGQANPDPRLPNVLLGQPTGSYLPLLESLTTPLCMINSSPSCADLRSSPVSQLAVKEFDADPAGAIKAILFDQHSARPDGAFTSKDFFLAAWKGNVRIPFSILFSCRARRRS